MEYVLRLAKEGMSNGLIDLQRYTFLEATKYYFSAMHEIKEHSIAMEYMERLFDSDICKKIVNLFEDVGRVIQKQYPGFEKNGISNRDKYFSAYEAVSHYTFVLRTKQQKTIIRQDAIKEVLSL